VQTVIDKLDKGLIEASGDLGAKPVATFFHVTLPLTAPGIFAGSIMVFIPSLGYFFVANLMGGGTNQLIGNVIARQFKEAFNWPYGAVLSILLIAITLILVKLYTKSGGSVDDLGVM
jgi:spermidine/putrescine transport system permease protein